MNARLYCSATRRSCDMGDILEHTGNGLSESFRVRCTDIDTLAAIGYNTKDATLDAGGIILQLGYAHAKTQDDRLIGCTIVPMTKLPKVIMEDE